MRRSRRRRNTLRRNLARRARAAPSSAVGLCPEPEARPAPHPERSADPREEARLRESRSLARLRRSLAAARQRLPDELRPSEVLAEFVRATGLRRGLLALCDGRQGEFRVDYQRGFRPQDLRDLRALVVCMRDAIDARHSSVRLGSAIAGNSGLGPGSLHSRKLGAVTAIPIFSGRRLLGVVALEDPTRSLPPAGTEVALLSEHARGLGPALERCLRRRSGRASRAS